jgi:hypothetical protein
MSVHTAASVDTTNEMHKAGHDRVYEAILGVGEQTSRRAPATRTILGNETERVVQVQYTTVCYSTICYGSRAHSAPLYSMYALGHLPDAASSLVRPHSHFAEPDASLRRGIIPLPDPSEMYRLGHADSWNRRWARGEPRAGVLREVRLGVGRCGGGLEWSDIRSVTAGSE